MDWCRRCNSCGSRICDCQYLGWCGLSERQQPADGRQYSVPAAYGCSHCLVRLYRRPSRSSQARSHCCCATRSVDCSIPFALAVLIVYFYPLIAAVIVATFGWEKFAWRTGAAILLAIVGLAMALDVRGGNLNVSGVSLAFVAAVGLAVVVAVSSRVFGNGDARPVTLYMSASASALLLLLCAARGDFAFPQTGAGWVSFGAAAAFYGFAIITFFIAISMIGPIRASLFSYSDAVISAILGVVVLGQALTLVQVAGITLVIIALISATVRRDHAT